MTIHRLGTTLCSLEGNLADLGFSLIKEQFSHMLFKVLLISQIVPLWFPFILCLKGKREPKKLFLKNIQASEARISDKSSRQAFLLLGAVRGLGGPDAGRLGRAQPVLATGSLPISMSTWRPLQRLCRMDTSSPRWSAVIPQERLSDHGRPEALAQTLPS